LARWKTIGMFLTVGHGVWANVATRSLAKDRCMSGFASSLDSSSLISRNTMIIRPLIQCLSHSMVSFRSLPAPLHVILTWDLCYIHIFRKFQGPVLILMAIQVELHRVECGYRVNLVLSQLTPGMLHLSSLTCPKLRVSRR
jgi:hypothetical protein